ncbi:hypothetical protein GKZ75_08520 [Kocuria indica]|uniref:Uncharacterized protein n=1 Tax=Kocuria marina subsp. indica TaxID=1049583 RepID=A0A6N9QYF2_9MICC|nr:hypothetical protein [Kocuria indica]NDO78265.1 hypothetical protein [Kocuria indica]
MPNPIEAAWAYQAATAKIQRSLFVAVRRLWKSLPVDPYAARDALIEQGTALAERYGQAAVGVASEFFEAATGLRATPVDVDLSEQVEGSARWSAGDLFAGNPQAAQKKFTGAMQRHALQPGRDTLFESSNKRGVRFARVPVGDTCTWCLMLASRGFVYTSARHAGQGNEWHDWCDCFILASQSKDIPVDYDPEALYEMYLNAHDSGDTGSDVARKMRQLYGFS